jgi:hypothetical protein
MYLFSPDGRSTEKGDCGGMWVRVTVIFQMVKTIFQIKGYGVKS